MGKLEETFNIPDTIMDIEAKANELSEHFNDDEDTELDSLIKDYKATTEISFHDYAEIKQYDREMDQIAKKALVEFEDLMALGKDVETRHAGEIFSAGAQMAKIALDAKTNKMNAKLKILELGIRKKRNDLLDEKQQNDFGNKNPGDPDTNSTEGAVISRAELMEELAELVKNKKSDK